VTELELFKFIVEKKIESHYSNDGKEIYSFIDYDDLSDFNKLLGIHILDEEGIKCTMKDGYVAFEMIAICEWFNIEPNNVFEKELVY